MLRGGDEPQVAFRHATALARNEWIRSLPTLRSTDAASVGSLQDDWARANLRADFRRIDRCR